VRLRALFIPLVGLTVFIVDQVTKYIVAANFALNEPWYPISFLKPLFAIMYIQNTGAAFGILQNQNLFFTIVGIIVICVILVYLRTTPQIDLIIALGLGLELGATFGNLADRVRFGYVTDFLYVKYFAVSNVADVCVTTGVLLLAYYLIFRVPAETSGKAPSAAPTDTPSVTDDTPRAENP
jgi:signal peptidase II